MGAKSEPVPLIPAQCALHVGVTCAVNTGAETNTWMCPGVGDSSQRVLQYVVELCWAIECSQTIQKIPTRQTLHNRHNTSTHCLHTLTNVEADM